MSLQVKREQPFGAFQSGKPMLASLWQQADGKRPFVPSQQLVVENLVGDIIIGASVTAAVSPTISIIDKAVVENAAGKKLLESAASSLRQMLKHPLKYLRSPTFQWMWFTYSATYITANILKQSRFEHIAIG